MSGKFAANAAWLTLAAISGNLLRAAGCLASGFHARARGATIRRDLIDVAARTARRGRGHLTLHLPECWPREPGWQKPVRGRLRPAAATPSHVLDPERSPQGPAEAGGGTLTRAITWGNSPCNDQAENDYRNSSVDRG